MFFSDRNQLRKIYFTAWQKFSSQEPLSHLEEEIVTLIQQHPEYLPIIKNLTTDLQKDYATDTNPFLHLGLHLSVREQVQNDRPKGIADIYQKLIAHHNNSHQVEHLMMDILGEILWQAQQNTRLADEFVYLDKLRSLL